MAMITCRECGKPVSDRALACPNCGFSPTLMLGYEYRSEAAIGGLPLIHIATAIGLAPGISATSLQVSVDMSLSAAVAWPVKPIAATASAIGK